MPIKHLHSWAATTNGYKCTECSAAMTDASLYVDHDNFYGAGTYGSGTYGNLHHLVKLTHADEVVAEVDQRYTDEGGTSIPLT